MGADTHQIVIVGGGAAGLSVAGYLLRHRPRLDIAIIEPCADHYYQPAWTLVGGGAYAIQATRRAQARCIPTGAHWIRHAVAAFEPERNAVVLDDDTRLTYDILVVAAGIQLDWGRIEGLTQTLGKNGVSSNYRFDLAPYTWECIRNLRRGRALFTQPAGAIKCAGAPQKIMYLAADYFRAHGVSVDVRFCTATASVFGVPFYAAALDRVVASYAAKPEFNHDLVAVDGPRGRATFEVGPRRERVEMEFDMIHVVPPQSAPDFIRRSALAGAAGWLAVDPHSLRHVRYANVFGLGDCTSAPNSKTAAAVRAQVPVVAANLFCVLDGRGPSGAYDGYAACPVTTSRGKVMLCEFAYDGAITPSFPLDPRKPRRAYWWLKKSYLPGLYWRMLRGRLGPDRHTMRRYRDQLPRIAP